MEDVAIVDLSADRAAGGGAAFGTLVHAVIALAPFDASPASLRDLATLEARVLGVTDDAAEAAAQVVERVLKHDILRRARAADARGACRRETPVTCRIDGQMIEGTVDMAFEESGAWTVVDYKTDREISAEGVEQYRRQVALYASAIAQATGQPASGVLIRV